MIVGCSDDAKGELSAAEWVGIECGVKRFLMAITRIGTKRSAAIAPCIRPLITESGNPAHVLNPTVARFGVSQR